jgi:hypothetical protein
VSGADANDWEDIAASGSGNSATIWIGDIGDNNRDRSNLCVYSIDEPVIDKNDAEKKLQSSLAHRYPFKYPDGSHDAETLLVDPRTQAVYIVSKESSGISGLYKFPMPLTRDRKVTLEKVGTLTFTNPLRVRGHNIGKLATGGDISEDGSKIVVRTYADAFIWKRGQGQTVEQAMAAKPQTISVPFIGQYEAICWDGPEAKALLTAPEGSPCPIWRVILGK